MHIFILIERAIQNQNCFATDTRTHQLTLSNLTFQLTYIVLNQKRSKTQETCHTEPEG